MGWALLEVNEASRILIAWYLTKKLGRRRQRSLRRYLAACRAESRVLVTRPFPFPSERRFSFSDWGVALIFLLTVIAFMMLFVSAVGELIAPLRVKRDSAAA
jgi:hypothetical protein